MALLLAHGAGVGQHGCGWVRMASSHMTCMMQQSRGPVHALEYIACHGWMDAAQLHAAARAWCAGQPVLLKGQRLTGGHERVRDAGRHVQPYKPALTRSSCTAFLWEGGGQFTACGGTLHAVTVAWPACFTGFGMQPYSPPALWIEPNLCARATSARQCRSARKPSRTALCQ